MEYRRLPAVRLAEGVDSNLIETDGWQLVEATADVTVATLAEPDADIVVIARHQIDEAAALAPHAELLCEPSPPELAAAIALNLAAKGAFVADRDRDLRRLAEEAARLARALTAFAEPAALRDQARDFTAEPAPEPSIAVIRREIRARRLRARFFDEGLFADPAWDMLLDLMRARIEGEAVAVSSLCIAAQVPPTTALRWIKQLTEDGLFVRRPDVRDSRRVFIELSPKAARAMAGWFAASAAD